LVFIKRLAVNRAGTPSFQWKSRLEQIFLKKMQLFSCINSQIWFNRGVHAMWTTQGDPTDIFFFASYGGFSRKPSVGSPLFMPVFFMPVCLQKGIEKKVALSLVKRYQV
jgi:hypothetical protein